MAFPLSDVAGLQVVRFEGLLGTRGESADLCDRTLEEEGSLFFVVVGLLDFWFLGAVKLVGQEGRRFEVDFSLLVGSFWNVIGVVSNHQILLQNAGVSKIMLFHHLQDQPIITFLTVQTPSFLIGAFPWLCSALYWKGQWEWLGPLVST